MKISFIGSGNVATHLALAFQKTGHSVLSVYSKNYQHAVRFCKKIKRCCPVRKISELNPTSEIIFICVTDREVEKIVSREFISKKVALVHTSGSMSLDVFSEIPNPCGVFYPLQTFTKNIPVDFSNVPVLLESKNRELLKKLKALSKSIGASGTVVNSQKRAWIHLSAVFASNFTNHLLSIAEKILKNNKLNFKLLHPLIMETFQKALRVGPEKAQTGPAKRGDSKIIKQHLKLLKTEPRVRLLYERLTGSIVDFKDKG